MPVSTTCYKKVQERIQAGADKEQACNALLVSTNPDDWQCRDNCKHGDGADFAPKKPDGSEFGCNKTAWGFWDSGSNIWATVSCAAQFNQTLFTKKFDSVPLPNPELNALAEAAMTKNPDPKTSGITEPYPCAEYNDAICPQYAKVYHGWFGNVTDYPAQCRTAQYWNPDLKRILGIICYGDYMLRLILIFFSEKFSHKHGPPGPPFLLEKIFVPTCTCRFFAHLHVLRTGVKVILLEGGPLCEDHHTTTTADLHCTSAMLMWSWSSHLHEFERRT